MCSSIYLIHGGPSFIGGVVSVCGSKDMLTFHNSQVVNKIASLNSDKLKDVIDEGVHDGHGAFGDTNV